MKIEQLSAIELGRKIALRELSSREVTEYFLARLSAADKSINAFTYVAGEKAVAQAKRIDERLTAGEKIGPLAGVPVAIKECTLHARCAHDVRFAHAAELPCSLYRDGGEKVVGCRFGFDRQDQHG